MDRNICCAVLSQQPDGWGEAGIQAYPTVPPLCYGLPAQLYTMVGTGLSSWRTPNLRAETKGQLTRHFSALDGCLNKLFESDPSSSLNP